MTDPVDDRTHRADHEEPDDETLLAARHDPDDRTRLAERRSPDDETLLAARHTPDDETLLAERRAADDATLLAERRVDEETRMAERREASDPPGRGVVHGRADTPRSASTSGTLASRAVYAPRGGEAPPAITRAPVAPPTATTPAAAARPRRGGFIAITVVGVTLVAGAVWGIIQIVQGGM